MIHYWENYSYMKFINKVIEKIRTRVSKQRIQMNVNQTTVIESHCIATNMIIGTLKAEPSGSTFLLHSKQLDKTNFSTINKTFDESISNGIQPNCALLLLAEKLYISNICLTSADKMFHSLRVKIANVKNKTSFCWTTSTIR